MKILMLNHCPEGNFVDNSKIQVPNIPFPKLLTLDRSTNTYYKTNNNSTFTIFALNYFIFPINSKL